MNINNILTNFWSSIKTYLGTNYQPKGSYANSSHTHDDRYYTESEINTKLNGKSDTSHNHNSTYLGINAKATSASSADSATTISQKIDASGLSNTNYPNNGTYVPTMNFLSYWNGSYSSKGASNLNYCANGVIIGSNNIGSQSVNYANSAGAVAWSNVSGKPTIPSNTNQLTNGAGFITSSGSCNYANSAGSAGYASRSAGNGAFYISGYQIYVG